MPSRATVLMRPLEAWPLIARLTLGLAGAFLVVGCRSQMCPAGDVRSRDPLLTIASARNSQTGAAITRLTLSEIRANGRLQTAADVQFYTKHALSRNIFGDGERLICTVECAIGGEPGPWEFTISAPGFQDRRVSYDLRYAGTESDKCTTYLVGGLSIDVTLDPAP